MVTSDSHTTRTPEVVASLEDVTLRYENGTQALEGVTLQVRSGEHLCVLGANGSGKSTLASVLCGLLAPDSGSVTLVGEHVYDATREQPIDYDAYRRARRSLGLVFQNPEDQMVTTVVEEDVAFGPENLGVDPQEIGRRVERELRRVAMTEYAKADPTRLSGGQRQRVAIAGALAMEPRLLVLDEPGSLLDVRGRSAIMRVMGRLHTDGTTIVHITHFMEEALEADRVLVMNQGHIVLAGTPQEVFSHADEIARLGLEEPFVAQVAQRLGLPWTCDQDELVRAIAKRAEGRPARASRYVEERPVRLSMDVPEDVVRVERTSYAYRRQRKALADVSFNVAQGASVAIVGQTGSGKSTLVRLLCALERPDSGHVVIFGIDTTRKRDRRRLHGRVGYVMQHPERQLFAETVLKDVSFGPTNLRLPAEEIDRRAHHALQLVGLSGLDDASPFELSGGQQRLCAIAGVLAMEPDVLILDEPTAGLDPRGRRELHAVLDDIHDHGVTVIQVTHSMDDAARAEHVLVLDQARILLEGTPQQVFCAENAPKLEAIGLGLPAPVALALALEEAGVPSLGKVRTMDDLVSALQEEAMPYGG